MQLEAGKKMYQTELVLTMSFCLYIFFQIMGTTEWSNFSGWVMLSNVINLSVCFMIAACVLIFNHFSPRWVVLVGLYLVFGAAVAVQSGRLAQVVVLVGFICSGVYIKSDRFIYAYLVVAIAAIALTLILYHAGIFTHDYELQGTRERLYLGFHYTTYLPNYFFHIVLAYVAVKRKRITILETAVIVVLNYILYDLTDTRAVFYETILLLVLLWYVKFTDFFVKTKLFRWLLIISMPVLTVVMFYLAKSYDSAKPFYVWLNTVFTNRLIMGSQALQEYGISLFGNEIEWITGRYGIERTTAYFYVDSSFLNIYVTFGLVTLVFVVVGFSILMYRAHIEKKYVLCIVMLMLAVHSFADPQLFDLKYDPFLLVLGTAFLKNTELKIGHVVPHVRLEL